jgi:chemotaxis protein CheD
MYAHFNSRFNSQVITIHPGEYHATKDSVVLATVLGSCIAVALYDRRNQFGGLNHFMLPGNVNSEEAYVTNSGKYGLFAMEFLVNAMLKLGSKKQDLTAKVFGGGAVLRTSSGFSSHIPQSNINFAFSYLDTERIPIESSDVGGTQARKIFYFPQTSRVLLKRITGKLIIAVEEEEAQYLRKIKRETKKGFQSEEHPPMLF